MSERLGKLREEIDTTDENLIKLLAARFVLTREVGLVKLVEQLPATDVNREREKLERTAELANACDVPEPLAIGIVRMIMDEVVREHMALKEASCVEAPATDELGARDELSH